MSSTDSEVRDLDGDGEPEVMLSVNWSGTQCCVWSRIYRYDRKSDTYTVRRPVWGYYAATPKLRDLDGDGRVELVSLDDRFSRQFAWSLVRPLRIWSYRRGQLRDVTRRYPALIRKDAAGLWRLYLRERRSFARGVLPAGMAISTCSAAKPRPTVSCSRPTPAASSSARTATSHPRPRLLRSGQGLVTAASSLASTSTSLTQARASERRELLVD